MRKFVSSVFVVMLFVPAAQAAHADETELYLNIRRIGLELSKTEVRNSEQYQDSPIQALNADSQDFLKGVLDTALEYKKNKFIFNIY